MGCEVWIVPVIAIAVWIITSLMKGSEEKPEPRRRPRNEGEERAQPPVELDKFLAEVRRRKQGGQQPRERPRESVPVALPVEPVPVRVADRPAPGQLSTPPAPRPRPAPPSPPPAPRRPQPASPPAARRERQPARRASRSERAPPVLDVVPLEVIPVEPTLAGDLSQDSAEVGAAGKVHRAKKTAQQELLAGLLQSPQQLRNAVVLQEILSPPRCMRRHR